MNESRLFRRRLASRILVLLGAASLALPHAACSGDAARGGATPAGAGGAASGGAPGAAGSGGVEGTGAGGSGNAGGVGIGGSGSAASSGGAAVSDGGPGQQGAGGGTPGAVQQCFDWSPEAGACPTDGNTVLYELTHDVCPTTGWDPYKIDSGPVLTPDGRCCYMVELELCASGGRPFLVEDLARVAPACRGAGGRGWSLGSAGPSPEVEALAPDVRAALARAWTADALLEHASVASFARVSLQLLAVGAPADLVALSHQAALDEVRHAALCFALASAYAGEDVAPGPFPLGGEVRVGAGLAELAASTVAEGCVGETVAAVMAAEQLARATDPAVRTALAQIAADEARHAELAWRTVAWAVRAGGGEVRAAVEQALGQALRGARRARCAVAEGAAAAMAAHGRLDAATSAETRERALAEVVVPAAEALSRLGGFEARPADVLGG